MLTTILVITNLVTALCYYFLRRDRDALQASLQTAADLLKICDTDKVNAISALGDAHKALYEARLETVNLRRKYEGQTILVQKQTREYKNGPIDKGNQHDK